MSSALEMHSVRHASVMAANVYFTKTALRERDHILLYLVDSAGNVSAAASVLDELDRLIEVLEAFPLSFRISEDEALAARGLRVAPCGRYLVLYRVIGDDVYLEHMFHGSQDYARLV